MRRARYEAIFIQNPDETPSLIPDVTSKIPISSQRLSFKLIINRRLLLLPCALVAAQLTHLTDSFRQGKPPIYNSTGPKAWNKTPLQICYCQRIDDGVYRNDHHIVTAPRTMMTVLRPGRCHRRQNHGCRHHLYRTQSRTSEGYEFFQWIIQSSS
jgi:hypothetical protein